MEKKGIRESIVSQAASNGKQLTTKTHIIHPWTVMLSQRKGRDRDEVRNIEAQIPIMQRNLKTPQSKRTHIHLDDAPPTDRAVVGAGGFEGLAPAAEPPDFGRSL